MTGTPCNNINVQNDKIKLKHIKFGGLKFKIEKIKNIMSQIEFLVRVIPTK